MSLTVFRCARCGLVLFPARYFCPACGGGDWTGQAARRGRVTAATVVRRRAGAQEDVHIASVATDAGPTVVARLPRALPVGAEVALDMDAENRIEARPSTT
ncbi:MAG TPA: zinc ribbon domain-containing protein [Bordetella sp.]